MSVTSRRACECRSSCGESVCESGPSAVMTPPSARPDRESIDIRVRELRQLFNAIDPSPFNERDLDPAAEEFFVTWAAELPHAAPLRLVIHVDAPPGDAAAEAVARNAVTQFFSGRAEAARRRLRELFRRGRVSLAIGLAFLGCVLFIASALDAAAPANGLAAVLRESLLIGGWVAMWRPIEIFLYDWWPIRAEAVRFDRLAAMQVAIQHAGTAGASWPG